VFDQFNGMPMHVLLIHATVVFVPLLALSSVVYALVPRARDRVGWAAGLLAIAAPLSAFVSKESGEAFKSRLAGSGMTAQGLDAITIHQGYGDLTFNFTLGLGIATLLLILLTSRAKPLPRIPDVALAFVVVVLAGFAGYYIYRTGDTGAQIVWRVGA
jgi:hypothetical protein